MNLLKGNDVLTKAQCDALRGIAIIGIFLHNFCHWLANSSPKGAIKENEFDFVLDNSQRMWHYFTQGIDIFAPLQFLSFFGHYGVPIFLFLSGFGLVMKYEHKDAKPIKTLPFLGYYWLKLFRLMFIGYIIPTILFTILGATPQTWDEVVKQLALVANISTYPNPNEAMPTGYGPYWFFGLMLEVYVLYRLFIYPSRLKANSIWRWLTPVLIIVTATVLQECFAENTDLIHFMRYNIVIAALPFGLGILVGRFGMPFMPRWIWGTLAIVCLLLMAVMSMNFHTWLWSPVVVILGSISFIKLLQNSSEKGLSSGNIIVKPLVWMGALSSFIFVVHPIVRLPLFKLILNKYHTLIYSDYLWILVYIVGVITLALLYELLLKFIPSPRINNKTGKIIIEKRDKRACP
jgi:peptidoglycan/LPS O-acetylase OafA/YrhL